MQTNSSAATKVGFIQALCQEAISIGVGKYKYQDELSRTEIIRRWVKALTATEHPDIQVEVLDLALRGILVPGGRIQAAYGTDKSVTAVNCFVMDTIEDSNLGITTVLQQASETMRKGGGVGYDFTPIRPNQALVKGTHTAASGPLPYMDMFDAMCQTIISAGDRRGAMMGVLRCDHPDIEAFIDAKKDGKRLRNFNLSVTITDDFMEAVASGADWNLVHRAIPYNQDDLVSFQRGEEKIYIYKTVKAFELWMKILKTTYVFAEPGVIFIDKVNKMNNLGYIETIATSNPCGEQMLPPNGACVLGSVNVAALVAEPFAAEARVDLELLTRASQLMVRLLDNVIETTEYPLAAQRAESHNKRRQGIGFLGVADAMLMCGLRYGSRQALEMLETWSAALCHSAYRASIELAQERGAFPLFDAKAFLARPFIQSLPEDIRDGIRTHGIRNGCLLSHAPTGTIALLSGNVSSGIEPVFSWLYYRNVLVGRDPLTNQEIKERRPMFDPAYKLWCDINGYDFEDPETKKRLPAFFVTTMDLSVEDHVRTQAVCQRYIDSSISKTVNCPSEMEFDEFRAVYDLAYALGTKGCTTYRYDPAAGRGQVLEVEASPPVNKPDAVTLPLVTTKLPDNLPARRLRVKWPTDEEAIYVNISYFREADGRCRVVEVFITNADVGSAELWQTLGILLTHLLKRDCQPMKALANLRNVVGPDFAFVNQRSFRSRISLIADTLERAIGIISVAGADGGQVPEVLDLTPASAASSNGAALSVVGGGSTTPHHHGEGQLCKACGDYAVQASGGCKTCTSCGDSRCG